MVDITKEAAVCATWPTRERLRALKRIIPRADVEAALAHCGQGQTYCKRLPGWFLVWYVIALGLFCRDSYRQVFRWLQPFRRDAVPGRSTLCEARHRLGVAPLRHLALAAVRLLGKPSTPGAFYRNLRLMALDSFLVDLADTPANVRAFGRHSNGRAPAAFPQARVLALCEIGSHVLWRWQIKPHRRSETAMAPGLLRHVEPGMLMLWDRGFLSYENVESVVRRKAHLLARVKTSLIFEPIRTLNDGSYLAKLYPTPKARRRDEGGIIVRIIEYTFEDPGRPGSGEVHRLLTTLLDEKRDPAETLIILYHERWEEELAIDELKTHQRERPVLRSQTPRGVVQELYGMLLGHYVVRALMQEAAASRDVDPDRVSFTAALKILRSRLGECPASDRGRRKWYRDLVAEVAEEPLGEERRNRINPRVIKRKMSTWKKKRPEHRKHPQPTKQFRDSIVVLC